MNQNKDDMDNSMFLWIALLIIILVIVPAVYAAKAGAINGILLSISKLQLKSFMPFSAEAQKAWAYISEVDPASLTWEKMQAILSYTGKFIRWPYVLMLGAFGAVSIFMGRTGGLVRRLNMESLLKNNAESFPCLRPIVGRGKYLLSPESYDAGNWQIARSPVQFALEHSLLLDEKGNPYTPEQALNNGLASTDLPAYGNAHFDEKKAVDVLQEQLGAPFKGFEALTPGRKALACAFLAYAGGNKKECVEILDAVSASYTEKTAPVCPVLEQDAFQKRLAKVCKKHEIFLNTPLLVRHKAFELPWFMALLTRARQKGVLASSQFLWLRPLDRPLWYSLNQCGGRAAWAEGFASWAHYAAEEKAGKSQPEPRMAQAVSRLKDNLASQGWLTDTPPPPGAAKAAPQFAPRDGINSPVPELISTPEKVEPDPDAIYAPADDDVNEYDANEDKALSDEQ